MQVFLCFVAEQQQRCFVRPLEVKATDRRQEFPAVACEGAERGRAAQSSQHRSCPDQQA